MVGDEDDDAVMYYGSGTTGRPKGILVAHKNLFWFIISCFEVFDLRREDRVLFPIPLIHGFGFTGQLVAFVRGCTIVLVKDSDPMKTLQTILEEKVNVFFAVPTLVHQLAEIPNFERYMKNVRRVLTGGGNLNESLLQKYARNGIRIGNV